eukprot:749032-Rhodomonas_salina.1
MPMPMPMPLPSSDKGYGLSAYVLAMRCTEHVPGTRRCTGQVEEAGDENARKAPKFGMITINEFGRIWWNLVRIAGKWRA